MAVLGHRRTTGAAAPTTGGINFGAAAGHQQKPTGLVTPAASQPKTQTPTPGASKVTVSPAPALVTPSKISVPSVTQATAGAANVAGRSSGLSAPTSKQAVQAAPPPVVQTAPAPAPTGIGRITPEQREAFSSTAPSREQVTAGMGTVLDAERGVSETAALRASRAPTVPRSMWTDNPNNTTTSPAVKVGNTGAGVLSGPLFANLAQSPASGSRVIRHGRDELGVVLADALGGALGEREIGRPNYALTDPNIRATDRMDNRWTQVFGAPAPAAPAAPAPAPVTPAAPATLTTPDKLPVMQHGGGRTANLTAKVSKVKSTHGTPTNPQPVPIGQSGMAHGASFAFDNATATNRWQDNLINRQIIEEEQR